MTVTGQANGFYISGKNWITVSGFTVTNTSDHGLYVSSGSSHITLANNHVSASGDTAPGKTKSGIYFSNVSDSLIVGNTADHNSSYGIYLTSGSTRNVVDGNTSFSNAMGYQRAASGIRLYSSPGNTISNNVSHDNEDSGIEFDTNAESNLTFNNVIYNNGDHGIDDYKSPGQTIVANTVYKNVTAGINIEGNSTGATIANNISVDNGIKSPRTHSNIRVESGSTSGTTLDYDLVYLTTADTLLIWNSVGYTSLAAFRSASGQETHAIQADPRWTNVAGGNFHLTSGSPAIDSANAGIAGQPSLDVEGTARIDDPITPNTGVGIRAYDDRGAYEFNAPSIDHVVISPSTSTMVAGDSRTYTAQAFDASGNPVGDVTGSTTFSIAPDGSCTGNVCTATKAGTHTVTGNVGGKTSTASLSVTAGAPDHLVLAPASATIASGGSRVYTAEGRDQYDNSLGDVSSSTVFSISPDGSCLAASLCRLGRGPSYGDRHSQRCDRKCLSAGDRRHARPHRGQPFERVDRGGWLADVRGARVRCVRQSARGCHREHDLLDRAERLLQRCQLHRDVCWGAHGDGERRRQDRHGVVERHRGCARPSSARPGLGDDRGGRLAGVQGGGARPVRQLARRRDVEHDLLDRSEWLLQRCQLHGDVCGGAHGDRDEGGQDRLRLAAGDRRCSRSHRDQPFERVDRGGWLAGLHGRGLRRLEQLAR